MLQNNQLSLGKAAELILSLREKSVNMRNFNLVEQYARRRANFAKKAKFHQQL